jgi:hypothetical protein
MSYGESTLAYRWLIIRSGKTIEKLATKVIRARSNF